MKARGQGWHTRHAKRIKRRKEIAKNHTMLKRGFFSRNSSPQVKEVKRNSLFGKLWGIVRATKAFMAFRNLIRNVAAK